MPKAVKEAAARADEMIRQNAAAALEAEGSTAPDADEDTLTPPDEADVLNINQNAQVQPLIHVDNDDDTTSMPTQLEDDGVDSQITALQAEAEKANQRWRSLQGQINSKDKQIEQLHTLLANMQAAPAPDPTVTTPAGYTVADTEAFGEDMIDVIERVSRQIAQSELSGYAQTVSGLAQEVDAVSQHTAGAVTVAFESNLDKLAPNWQALNEDEEFIGWLKTSPTRVNVFATAAEQKDAPGVAEFFNMYSNLMGLDEANRQAATLKKKRKQEGQIAPGKSKSVASPVSSQPEEKNWTKSEIALVYRNKSKYPADDFAKLERTISAAMQAGRVDYTQ